jgi:HK97 family phage portal protein
VSKKSRKKKALARATTPSEQPMAPRIIFTGRTPAGVYVDADIALKNATVWACVQYLSRAVAQLPWRVMREEERGGKVAPNHPADWLLHKRPCPDMGAFSWRQGMLGQALLRGNAYAEIERDNRGLPYALWPLHPDRVCVRRDAGGALVYEVWNRGGNVVLQAMDVFHLRGFGDGPVGYSVIEYAAQSIGWAQATELFGSSFFADGMNPSGIVKLKTGMSPEGLELLKENIARLYSGPRGKRTAVLDAGMDFEKITTTPEDGQFIETRQHQVEEICRWFGVPPHKVMHLLRATFSNIEHQAIEVVVDSVTPWVRTFEEEADYKLFGPQNRQGFYTKMNLRALLRGDNASRAAFYKALFEVGALSPNEIRDLEDMDGIGDLGDQRFRSQNLAPLDPEEAAKIVRPAAAPAEPDPEAPPPPATAESSRRRLS